MGICIKMENKKMNNEFYKLNKDLKTTLNKILNINEYDKHISETEFIKSHIKKLIDVGYLSLKFDASTLGEWIYIVNVTYDGEHYDEIKKEHNKRVIEEWIKFWIPISLSIVSLITSILINI